MDEIKHRNAGWVITALEIGARWLIVVCDTFDFEDYPVYVGPGQDIAEERAKYDGVHMQRVHEVIDLGTRHIGV